MQSVTKIGTQGAMKNNGKASHGLPAHIIQEPTERNGRRPANNSFMRTMNGASFPERNERESPQRPCKCIYGQPPKSPNDQPARPPSGSICYHPPRQRDNSRVRTNMKACQVTPKCGCIHQAYRDGVPLQGY
jgi:hypothetical protein